MLRFSMCPTLGAAFVVAALSVADAQSSVTLSPFVTLIPAGSSGSMVGLALTFGGGPLALRAGGQLSMRDRTMSPSANSTTITRPWSADADMLAFLEHLTYGDGISFAPYVFAGVSRSAVDSGTLRLMRQGWSYGSGVTLPLGSALGAFAEWRWRMTEFVMPNAADAPSPTSEARVGLTFRVGGGGGGGVVGDPGAIIPSGSDGGGGLWDESLPAVIGRLLSMADRFVGTRYRRGGMSPSSGFDASGFVRFVFARFGVILPRTSRDQARVGDRVDADWHVIAPGDLVMFEDDGGIRHVAIYVGRGRIIHSSETGGGVRYDDLDTERGRWFLDHMVAARRVTPDVRGLLLDLARGFTAEDANDSDAPDRAPRATLKRRR